MSIRVAIGMDGFTTLAQANRRGIYAYSSGLLSVQVGAGRWGGNAIVSYGAQYGNMVPFTTVSGDTVNIAFAWMQTLASTTTAFSLARGILTPITGGGVNAVFYMKQGAGGLVTVYNAASAVIGTFTMPLDGIWHWWNIKVTALGSTSGSITIYMDNTEVMFQASGVNLAGSSATGTNWCFAFGYSYSTITPANGLMDDLIIADTSGTQNTGQIPDCRIFSELPNSLDAAGSFTANTGTIYEAIDDPADDDDTTYISSSTAGDTFYVGLEALGLTPKSILAVTGTLIAKKTGTEGTTLTAKLKSGTAVASGTAKTLATDYDAARVIAEVDPNTGLAWTLSAVNALKLGGTLS